MSSAAMPPVVSLIGKSNSGKTTFLEKLIPALISLGVRVGTIKHHVHEFEMDRPGKDTWRHKQAGAAVVALSSPSGLGIIRDTHRDLTLDEVIGKYFDDVDLVISEGFKTGPAPKIEIFRSAAHREPLSRDSSWIAMISDTEIDCALPIFSLDDEVGVARFLVDTLIAPAKGT